MPDDTTQPSSSAESSTECIRLVCVQNETGLHARPAARLSQAAQSFEADISIAMNGRTVDAKSILDILTLAAGHGANLELKATGADASEALEHLASLFKNRFQ